MKGQELNENNIFVINFLNLCSQSSSKTEPLSFSQIFGTPDIACQFSYFFGGSPSTPNCQPKNSPGRLSKLMRAEAQGAPLCCWTKVVQQMPAFRQAWKKPVPPIEITEAYGPMIIWNDRLINPSMRCSTWRGKWSNKSWDGSASCYASNWRASFSGYSGSVWGCLDLLGVFLHPAVGWGWGWWKN